MFKDQPEILFALITISIVLLVLGLLISIILYLHKKKVTGMLFEKKMLAVNFEKTLLQSQIEVQEATYSALGKELHDNVGQLLSSAKMLIGITERTLDKPPETLTTANETLGKAINELRSLSKSLNREWLEQFDLLDNLKAEADRINISGQIRVHFSHPDKLNLISDEQLILFRIIQEAIQNAIRHSGATNITVSIVFDGSILITHVKDDGGGMEGAQRNGVGILNMKHRVKLLGGNIEWINDAGGVNVQITIPVNKQI